MEGIDDLMSDITDLSLKDISTLEKGMQAMVKEELRRYKLEIELKNQLREEASFQTIQTLHARVAELEATVTELEATVTELKLENIRLIEGGSLQAPNEAAASYRSPNWNSEPENNIKYPDIEILQTPGYASANMHSKFDEIERRNQKVRRALNIEGSHLGMTSTGEYFVHN